MLLIFILHKLFHEKEKRKTFLQQLLEMSTLLDALLYDLNQTC